MCLSLFADLTDTLGKGRGSPDTSVSTSLGSPAKRLMTRPRAATWAQAFAKTWQASTLALRRAPCAHQAWMALLDAI